MATRARVLRGEDAGDYRREETDYGSVFWRRTDKPHQCPVTDGTFQRYLKSGKAVPLGDAPEAPAVAVVPDADEPEGDIATLDTAEDNWLAEVRSWTREQRARILELAGVKVHPSWSKHQLADELLNLHRRKRGTSRKAPRRRQERPKAANAPTVAPVAVRLAASPAGWPASLISAPGAEFPAGVRAEDFYPVVESNRTHIDCR